MRILHLTLRKKPFDLIAAGIKKEEYRAISIHWIVRLIDIQYPDEEPTPKKCHADWILESYKEGHDLFDVVKHLYSKVKQFDAILFRNGYSANAPSVLVEWKGLDIGPAVPEWADGMEGEFFRIHLGGIIETKNIK